MRIPVRRLAVGGLLAAILVPARGAGRHGGLTICIEGHCIDTGPIPIIVDLQGCLSQFILPGPNRPGFGVDVCFQPGSPAEGLAARLIRAGAASAGMRTLLAVLALLAAPLAASPPAVAGSAQLTICIEGQCVDTGPIPIIIDPPMEECVSVLGNAEGPASAELCLHQGDVPL